MPLEGHLDELRSRLIVSLAVFGVALALCFWQNHLLLEIASGPLPDNHGRLITFSVTEPFTTTMKVAAYGAIILSLPILLYELYAFFLPAISAQQRKTVTPLLMLTPVLFIAGVVFAYFVVVPAALNFLLNFNDSQFNVQLKASEYYGFMATTLIACGEVSIVLARVWGTPKESVEASPAAS
jgi:Tat protein translocase TatC